eukprot:158211-Pyramimonas_sp.AAC.1
MTTVGFTVSDSALDWSTVGGGGASTPAVESAQDRGLSVHLSPLKPAVLHHASPVLGHAVPLSDSPLSSPLSTVRVAGGASGDYTTLMR